MKSCFHCREPLDNKVRECTACGREQPSGPTVAPNSGPGGDDRSLVVTMVVLPPLGALVGWLIWGGLGAIAGGLAGLVLSLLDALGDGG